MKQVPIDFNNSCNLLDQWSNFVWLQLAFNIKFVWDNQKVSDNLNVDTGCPPRQPVIATQGSFCFSTYTTEWHEYCNRSQAFYHNIDSISIWNSDAINILQFNVPQRHISFIQFGWISTQNFVPHFYPYIKSWLQHLFSFSKKVLHILQVLWCMWPSWFTLLHCKS